ncbi:hypothetical protein PAPYR_32 [Paratrimastix pyriformis]|uniref:Uncharacterized protein n=1 Tax=Paratrimastix pyriformis TaxID=342808 RepID=A0ABQ8UXK8_9EUKA|nr:hypothetical protein PAPYR_32 [Paratrimastix pyriformis]
MTQHQDNIRSCTSTLGLADLFVILPRDLLLSIVEASNYPLSTYAQLLSISHPLRWAVRGIPRELSFDATLEGEPPVPTADALAALIGPCKGLVKLSFCSSGSTVRPNVYGCGCTEAACAGWVDEAFGGHDRLTILNYLPTCSERVIERILIRLPGLSELRLGRYPRISTHLLAAIARSCPHLQSLRCDAGLGKVGIAVLAPLAGSLHQLRFGSTPPAACPTPFVSSLTAVETLHLHRCDPVALKPLASHLTRLCLEIGGSMDKLGEDSLPGPWFTRLERLTLRGCPPLWAPLTRLLAANQATLRRLKLTILKPSGAADPGLAPLMAALDALPRLTHLMLAFEELPPEMDVITTLPPGLLCRLEDFTLGLVDPPADPEFVVRPPLGVVSDRLRRFRLSLVTNNAIFLDCPALVELHLPATHTDALILNCPRLRQIRNLPAHASFSAPMPDLERVTAPSSWDPVWLPDLLAVSPRLRSISLNLTRPDMLSLLCACATLVEMDLDLDTTRTSTTPLVLRPSGRLESLRLAFQDAVVPVDLAVEAPGLRRLVIEGMHSGGTLTCRLGCPALTRLSLLLVGCSITALELDQRAQLHRLAVAGNCPPAMLLDVLVQHGARLRHVELYSVREWPRVAATLGGLTQLTSLELFVSNAPSPLSLTCPPLRTLTLYGMAGAEDRVMLTCPLLEALEGLHNSSQLVLTVPAPNLPPLLDSMS